MDDVRTLDCAVAEQVMGYVWATFDATFAARLHGPRFLLSPDNSDLGTVYAVQPDRAAPLNDTLFNWHDKVPPYSTDIAAAWQVVDALHAEGWRLNLGPNYDMDGWICRFAPPRTVASPVAYGAGASVPESICRAALVVGTETLGDNDPDLVEDAAALEEAL